VLMASMTVRRPKRGESGPVVFVFDSACKGKREFEEEEERSFGAIDNESTVRYTKAMKDCTVTHVSTV
jgi:hypothetical protein